MPEETVKPPTETTQPFTRVLAQIEGGVLHDDLSDDVRELCAKLSQHAADNGVAKGALTLVLNFRIERGGVMEIDADVKVKTPRARRERSVFWLTPGNNLTPENPRQLTFGPRKVEAAAEPPRDVGTAEPVKKI